MAQWIIKLQKSPNDILLHDDPNVWYYGGWNYQLGEEILTKDRAESMKFNSKEEAQDEVNLRGLGKADPFIPDSKLLHIKIWIY